MSCGANHRKYTVLDGFGFNFNVIDYDIYGGNYEKVEL